MRVPKTEKGTNHVKLSKPIYNFFYICKSSKMSNKKLC